MVKHGEKAPGRGKSKGGKKSSGKTGSRSEKAGIQFPVGRIGNCLKHFGFSRISDTSAVFMAAVLEYLCAEVLELAGNTTRETFKKTRIRNAAIAMALAHDEELASLTRRCIIGRSGNPGGIINPALMPQKSKGSQ